MYSPNHASSPGTSPPSLSFHGFLRDATEAGRMTTTDLVAAVLPLIKQVIEAHDEGKVAPLRGVASLSVTHARLWYPNAREQQPTFNTARIEEILPENAVVEVASVAREGRLVIEPGDEFLYPVFVTAYETWEHQIGHHDPLSDVFSLGMIIASLALGLDFDNPGHLTRFVEHRRNLFVLEPELHPAINRAILGMTEPNRRKRTGDLAMIVDSLENHGKTVVREDSDAPKEMPDKNRAILRHLRDRLFDISRRNRLIYFKPNAQTLNLTGASLPELLDFHNILRDDLATWNESFSRAILSGDKVPLGNYLPGEVMPGLTGKLDQIRRESNRDEKECGFSPLRLVITFLRWHNLRDDTSADTERIHSPLLLLPVKMESSRGQRSSDTLQAIGSEAEVNPAVRHYLRELYDIRLPESVDLEKDRNLDVFFGILESEIRRTEKNVELRRGDKPEIKIRFEKATRRLDTERTRARIPKRYARAHGDLDYSYSQKCFEPLGLQLYRAKVKPTVLPLEFGNRDRETYEFETGDDWNVHTWFFDQCAITIGNFRFQKMSLVSDYEQLGEHTPDNPVFDQLFSRELPGELSQPPALELGDQHIIAPSDPSQINAIAWARTGENFIIQGPPGTGKSQTITNLIADYVARGKRVLFVCEKRAALDVVYSRLAAAGLDRYSCLIHDTTVDKKPLIVDLRQTWRDLVKSGESGEDGSTRIEESVRSMENGLGDLERFGKGMIGKAPDTEIPVISLLERLIAIGAEPQMPREALGKLPGYQAWQAHGTLVHELAEILTELGREPIFARHPLSELDPSVYGLDNPTQELRAVFDETSSSVSGLADLCTESPFDLRQRSVSEVLDLIELAAAIRFFFEESMLDLLQWDSEATKRFHQREAGIRANEHQWQSIGEQTIHWKEKLPSFDAGIALERAEALESARLRWLRPSFWKLRRLLRNRYLFSAHPFSPKWSKVLATLLEEYAEEKKVRQSVDQLGLEFGTSKPGQLRAAMAELEREREAIFVSELRQDFLDFVRRNVQAQRLIQQMKNRSQVPAALLRFDGILPAWRERTARQLCEVHGQIRSRIGDLPALQNTLVQLAQTSPPFFEAVRTVELEPLPLEAALAGKSLDDAYAGDRRLEGFGGNEYRRICRNLREARKQWLTDNCSRVGGIVKSRFLETRETGDLTEGEAELKHQFDLQRGHKSIRELATGKSGSVVAAMKPVWLMTPSSISNALPLDPSLFDVVIFDEASQIRLEDAIPSLFRGQQVVVVGDEKQLPPTGFFHSGTGSDSRIQAREGKEEVEIDLGADSLLSHAARSLPSTMLNWHYRSRREELIAFCNNTFYGGQLLTIPDRIARVEMEDDISVNTRHDAERYRDRVFSQGISIHYVEDGTYVNRRNEAEARYIAELLRELLLKRTGKTFGIVSFSEAQQNLIEEWLFRLAKDDHVFEAALNQEFERVDDNQWVGLFVKNLENVQGDERDIIILSVCYGPGPDGQKMRMNFGPINQPGGEKRLNVILSRSKEHMVVVSSFRHHAITNDWNDGARCLKRFLEFAAASSRGDMAYARNVLAAQSARPAELPAISSTVRSIAETLESEGFDVETRVGQSDFRIDLAVRPRGASEHVLAILVDSRERYEFGNELDRAVIRPGILRAFGWKVCEVLTRDWHERRDEVLESIRKAIG